MARGAGHALGLTAMADPTTGELLAAAAEGDAHAWNTIVERYERLVWSVVRGFRLGEATAADVCQTVWLRLVENCQRIREPDRLPAWLCATAKNECLRTVRTQQRTIPSDFDYDLVDHDAGELDTTLLRDEQLERLAAAFDELADDCRRLLRLLVTDPPLDYDTISELIGRPKGSIGPTRARCLEKLRRILERGEGGGDHGDRRPGR